MSEPILRVENLSLELQADDHKVRLVDDVSFTLEEGEMMGLVGESGSGKSLTCRALLRLLPKNISLHSGNISIAGRHINDLSEKQIRKVRGRDIGMIFQNPSSYLNPVMTIGKQISEALILHQGLTKKEAMQQAVEQLRLVGIPDPKHRVNAYVHELSGGMRQRVMIAVGLVSRPKILIADEPTTALDVTVQAQILRLILELKDKLGLSIIFITHDLGIVAQTCDKVGVMYAGKLMETAALEDILNTPLNPYTMGLINSQPVRTPPGELLPSIPGQPPNLAELQQGCRFLERCEYAEGICSTEEPQSLPIGHNRSTACHVLRRSEQ